MISSRPPPCTIGSPPPSSSAAKGPSSGPRSLSPRHILMGSPHPPTSSSQVSTDCGTRETNEEVQQSVLSSSCLGVWRRREGRAGRGVFILAGRVDLDAPAE